MTDEGLKYQAKEEGAQFISWNSSLGEPKISSDATIQAGAVLSDDGSKYMIEVRTFVDGQFVEIHQSQ